MSDCDTVCSSPGAHRCQPLDDADAAIRNLLALERFAHPGLLPPFPEHRRERLMKLFHRIPRIPKQRAPKVIDLWPVARPAVEALHRGANPKPEREPS